MKHLSILFILLLCGCSINITSQSFIHQDEQVEPSLNLERIEAKLTNAPMASGLAKLSKTSITTPSGLTLNGINLSNNQAKVNVLLFGGNGMKISDASGILNYFSLLPANVIWFDYRGTGVSEKQATLSVTHLKQDALLTYDYAQESFDNQLPTIVHGISMGSVIATYVATQRPVAALVLDGAINSVPSLVDNLVPTWAKLFSSVTVSDELREINNVELIKQYSNPLLFLSGDTDTTTPVAFAQELYDASPSETKNFAVIHDTGHAQTMKNKQAIAVYQRFIATL